MPVLFAAPLLSGDAGTSQTIDKIRELVDDAWKDSYVNRAAIDIIRGAGVQPYDAAGQVYAIYQWVRANVYFVNDPVSKEALRPARELLQLRAGDCDDINAILLPALLGSLGYECRLVTIAADRRDPSMFSHVYAEVDLDGEWIPIDAARPGAQFGIAPQHFWRREWWALTGSAHGNYPAESQGAPMHQTSRLQPAFGLAGYSDSQSQDPNNLIGSALAPAVGPSGARISSCASDASPLFGCGGVDTKVLLWLGLGIGALWALGRSFK